MAWIFFYQLTRNYETLALGKVFFCCFFAMKCKTRETGKIKWTAFNFAAVAWEKDGKKTSSSWGMPIQNLSFIMSPIYMSTYIMLSHRNWPVLPPTATNNVTTINCLCIFWNGLNLICPTCCVELAVCVLFRITDFNSLKMSVDIFHFAAQNVRMLAFGHGIRSIAS